MYSWKVHMKKRMKLQRPVLIEGLPGAGNVGKIAVDFMIEDLKAVHVCEIFSSAFPNCVFISEKGVVALPKWDVYCKRVKGRDYLFLTGDVQPSEEAASYFVTERMLSLFCDTFGGAELVTLGGYAQDEIPESPRLHVVSTTQKNLREIKKTPLVRKGTYGTGPVVGVTGLLLGFAQRRRVSGLGVLAETYSDPMYLGVPGARALLGFLKERFGFRLHLKRLDEDLVALESEIKDKLAQYTEFQHEKNKELVSELAPYIG